MRELSALLENLRDEVAQLELEAETLRAELGGFEVRHRHALHAEERALLVIARVVRALEGWITLLRSAPAAERVRRARRHEERRTREAARERVRAVRRRTRSLTAAQRRGSSPPTAPAAVIPTGLTEEGAGLATPR